MANKPFKLASFSFIFLFLLGVGLRLWALNKVPLGLSWDEASIGYNAWSVLNSVRDEWGEFLPLHFQAFGEWKLPAYIYFDLPFVYVLGLNPLSVRLPSILAGIGGAIIFGLIWKKLKGAKTAFGASLLFLFSFWSFFLSRGAFEVNLGLFLFLGGWYLFLLKKVYPSMFLFVITLYTYNAFRIITPLFIVWLLFLYRQDFKKSRVFQSVLFLAGGSLPLFRFVILNRSALSRFGQVVPKGNRLLIFLKNYLSHFKLDFLLFGGDFNQRHFSQFSGQISFLVFSLGLLGLFLLIKNIKQNKLQAKIELAILGLLILAPIPAAITKESPHSLRSIALLPAFLSLACLGFDYLLTREKKLKSGLKRLSLCFILIVFAGQYWFFYQDYFTDYPRRSADDWQAGYKKLFEQVDELGDQTPVYLSTKKGQPYVFALFYHPRLIADLDHDVAQPKFWHESRLSRIENIYFLDLEKIVFQVKENKQGVYFIDPAEEVLLLQNLDYPASAELGKELILVNDRAVFYLFRL